MCLRRQCDVVYFGEDGTVIPASAMSVAPGFKTSSPDALVCYCFLYRRGDLEAELGAGGETGVADRIGAAVKAGDCACEVRNPSGTCCLGEVRRMIREIRAALSSGTTPS